jgi:hypothetical protein
MSSLSEDIDWTDELEAYFKRSGERANGLAWLHKHAEARFSMARNYIEIPVIVLGVFNGAASVGSKTLFGDSQYASVGVGIIVLLTAVLSTMTSYFKWAARAEAHRISAIQFARLHRFVAVQMGLARDERLQPSSFLREVKDTVDRLDEISPLIPNQSILDFQRKFSGPDYRDVAMPAEANGLERIAVFPRDDNVPALELSSPARQQST